MGYELWYLECMRAAPVRENVGSVESDDSCAGILVHRAPCRVTGTLNHNHRRHHLQNIVGLLVASHPVCFMLKLRLGKRCILLECTVRQSSCGTVSQFHIASQAALHSPASATWPITPHVHENSSYPNRSRAGRLGPLRDDSIVLH